MAFRCNWSGSWCDCWRSLKSCSECLYRSSFTRGYNWSGSWWRSIRSDCSNNGQYSFGKLCRFCCEFGYRRDYFVYTGREKELNWDNVKQSAVTVARDTAIDGTIGIVTDRAIPKLKPKLVPNTKKEAVKKIIYDSPRDFHVSTNSNIVTNGINNIAGRTEGNKQDTNYLIGLMLNSFG